MCARLAACLLTLAGTLPAHQPITTRLTWTLEISRILHRRCLPCHGPQSSIPLTTYDEARPWAKAIRDEVLERRMPPWDAAPGFGEFQNDPSLSQLEIGWIVDWVEGGAPRGNLIYAPSAPKVSPLPPAPPPPRGLRITRRYRLDRALRATGVYAESAAPGGSLQVLAALPGGRVAPLLWIPAFRQPRAYWFREALGLPAGTRVTVDGGVVILTTAPPAP